MKNLLATFTYLTILLISSSTAKSADPFDLASIGLHPSYLSASAYRENATLHAVGVSPAFQSKNPVNTRSENPESENRVVIAVGDGGTILRSEDGRNNWRAIDRITPLAEFEESTSTSSRFGSRRSKRPVIAMPFWHLYDVRWLSNVDVVAIGGGFEPVTGISRGVCLYSSDAGATWSMGNAHELPRLKGFANERDRARPGMIQAIGDRAESSGVNRFFSQDGGRTWIEDTKSHRPPSDNLKTSDSSPIKVGDYGQIWLAENGTWRNVRGQNRHAAVGFVCGSVPTTPWALIGREALHENNRVVVTMDSHTTPIKHSQWSDAAKTAGATVGNLRSMSDQSHLTDWLNEHRPTVLALDESLPESIRHNWTKAVQAVRNNRPNGQPTVQRIVLFRSNQERHLDRDAAAFKRSSTLRSDALLTGPAVLAGDFASDGFMMASAGTQPPTSIEVTTLDDLSGAIRRDISITSGISLSEGQVKSEQEQQNAASRRLQIATARVAQTTNLRNQLAAAIAMAPNQQTKASVEQTLRNAIAMTSPQDQTRLLWDRLVELMNLHREDGSKNTPGLAMVRSVLLKQLAQAAAPASIRRWARFTDQAIASSVEREWIHKADRPTARWPDGSSSGNTIGQTSHITPVVDAVLGSGESTPSVRAGRLSPFQVAPASYTRPANGISAPTAILIPETKPTVWQTPRGVALNRASDQTAAFESGDELQRVNWDYHPVVMAGRKIGQTDSATNSSALNPPMIANRPYLDGQLNDSCWDEALTHELTKVAQDQEFYFIGIASEDSLPHDSIRIRLDCDGDFLTSIQLDWRGKENRRTTVDELRTVPLTWYGSKDTNHHAIELAIKKNDLPGPLHRLRIDRTPDDVDAAWEAMPDATKWISSETP